MQLLSPTLKAALRADFAELPRSAPQICNLGRNVLACWPDEWSSSDNQQWADALEWRHVPGYNTSVKEDCGVEKHTMNFAFNWCFDAIPSRCVGDTLHFDCRNQHDFHRKQINFYAANQFMRAYPTWRQMEAKLGISTKTFSQQVLRCQIRCQIRCPNLALGVTGVSNTLLFVRAYGFHGHQPSVLGVQPCPSFFAAGDFLFLCLFNIVAFC